MLNAMRQSKQSREAAGRIYAAVVARSREPVFFARFGVHDTLDGRFDLLTLHVWLMLQRLQADARLSQALVDAVFVGFDGALRELGTGDIGMARRMKKIADAFYGRLKAYSDAADEAAMAAALTRNLYRGEPAPCARAMAAYVLQARERLAASEGAPDFGALPVEE
jgi:cytochrome b pre-mRNA-processing protein 3